ncbi:hypothetical protein Vretimale_10804 [Volvox reticuliferus]|uniref:Uncharacterized protein n=2 Tax=Volvox reticuliferus TaxID=1737510 RepID=A0A8J4GFF5_9CHLO|nr:hypothetical protein Vretimale_10804 [Volvox reticuliferus]
MKVMSSQLLIDAGIGSENCLPPTHRPSHILQPHISARRRIALSRLRLPQSLQQRLMYCSPYGCCCSSRITAATAAPPAAAPPQLLHGSSHRQLPILTGLNHTSAVSPPYRARPVQKANATHRGQWQPGSGHPTKSRRRKGADSETTPPPPAPSDPYQKLQQPRARRRTSSQSSSQQPQQQRREDPGLNPREQPHPRRQRWMDQRPEQQQQQQLSGESQQEEEEREGELQHLITPPLLLKTPPPAAAAGTDLQDSHGPSSGCYGAASTVAADVDAAVAESHEIPIRGSLEHLIVGAESPQVLANLLSSGQVRKVGNQRQSYEARTVPTSGEITLLSGSSPKRDPGSSPGFNLLGQRLLLLACRRMADLLMVSERDCRSALVSEVSQEAAMAVLCYQVLLSARAGMLGGAAFCEVADVLWRRLGCKDPWFWSEMLKAAEADLPSLAPYEIAALLEPAAACCGAGLPGGLGADLFSPGSTGGEGGGSGRGGDGCDVDRGPAAAVSESWLKKAEERLLQCAECIAPSDAIRLLLALAALHHSPRRSCSRVLVTVGGSAFRGRRWGPTPGPMAAAPPPAAPPAGFPMESAPLGIPSISPGSPSSFAGDTSLHSTQPPAAPGEEDRTGGRVGEDAEELSESQLRALLLAASAVDGAYPGEAWLADWCAAYEQYIVTHGSSLHVPPSGRTVTRNPHGATAIGARVITTAVTATAAEDASESCSDGGPPAGPCAAAVADILYCLASLQFVPPEHWEAAALEAAQTGLRPWLVLAAEVDPNTHTWAMASEPLPDWVPQEPPPDATLEGDHLPPLKLVQLAWAVGALAAACPLPPPPQSPSLPLSPSAVARAGRRRRMREHRRRVFGAALVAVTAWRTKDLWMRLPPLRQRSCCIQGSLHRLLGGDGSTFHLGWPSWWRRECELE